MEDEEINLINIENVLYFLFIFASLVNIYANNKLKQGALNGVDLKSKTRKYYVFAATLSLIVFLAFVYRNYYNLKKIDQMEDPYGYDLARIRLFGSIIIAFGQSLIIIYLVKVPIVQGSPI